MLVNSTVVVGMTGLRDTGHWFILGLLVYSQFGEAANNCALHSVGRQDDRRTVKRKGSGRKRHGLSEARNFVSLTHQRMRKRAVKLSDDAAGI
jgi:hypothetical protein